ncbi:MAG: CocE/NonD family hydrolase [Candidatus Acidiferrum sp.]
MIPISNRLIRTALLVLCAVASAAATRAQNSPAPTNYQVSAQKLPAYVGQYQYDDNPYLPVSVSLLNDKLYIESARAPRQELAPSGPDTFVPVNSPNPAIFKFILAPDGKVSGLTRIASDKSIRHARRISDQSLSFIKPEFSREQAMIPVRDGVKLHAVILKPKDAASALPILMERTPYGVDDYDSDGINGRYPELVHDGYIFVFEDIRGRYKSEGTFVMSRAMVDHGNPKLIDESTDTYDTVAWLIKNIPNNNGRVGVLGISYPGFLAQAAGIDPHPAVKAISPQAPMIDVWMGDDFFHNGAFRQSYGYDYTMGMESSKENAFGKLDEDAYDYFLKAGSFAAAAKQGGVDKMPTGIGFLKNPEYDDFWRSRGVEWHLNRVAVPTLLVGGFWDQEDMYGPQEAYEKLEPHDSAKENFLIIGPWNHGQWGSTTNHLGEIYFGEPTTDEFRARYEAPFFNHYLHEQGTFSLQDTAAFESGTNKWKEYSYWPPLESQARSLYLAANGTLLFDLPSPAPTTGSGQHDIVTGTAQSGVHARTDAADSPQYFTEYVSDPAKPIPYRHRPIQATYSDGSKWYTWMVEDQKTLLAGRNDYASWSTPVLDHDVTIAGNVIADLYASTSGTDSDWVVKLIDEYPAAPTTTTATTPDGVATADTTPSYQLIINAEIFRGRYRTSFEHPEAIPANTIEEYKWSLHAADHTFLKGHKIVVQVQSTWFPLYDRNPQTFVPNIMLAKPEDFHVATQRISAKSHIILPLLP